MITLDPEALARAVFAAIRENPALRDEFRAALDLEPPAKHIAITAAEYARRHSMGVSTVRAAIREGRLACERIGRLVRVPADAVIAPRTLARPAEALQRAKHVLGLVPGGRR